MRLKMILAVLLISTLATAQSLDDLVVVPEAGVINVNVRVADHEDTRVDTGSVGVIDANTEEVLRCATEVQPSEPLFFPNIVVTFPGGGQPAKAFARAFESPDCTAQVNGVDRFSDSLNFWVVNLGLPAPPELVTEPGGREIQ